MEDLKTMYQAVPAVSELNKVRGFDPTRYLRRTKDGPKLDLSVKKLWFRMRYPNGRIKLSHLKITEQLAIIEARVYFDKNDKESVSNYTAQRYKENSPGGLYIECAQHSAIDEALSLAGFGIQFVPASEAPHTVQAQQQPVKATPQTVARPTVKPPERTVEKPIVKTEPVVKEQPQPKPVEKETVVEKPDTSASAQTVAPTQVSTPAQTVTPVTEATVQAPKPVVEATPEPVTEVRENDTAMGYTKDMPVNEILARMTNEEAKNYVVTEGSCTGWRIEEVAARRLPSLKFYLSGYKGNDNILRAAATIMLSIVENKAA